MEHCTSTRSLRCQPCMLSVLLLLDACPSACATLAGAGHPHGQGRQTSLVINISVSRTQSLLLYTRRHYTLSSFTITAVFRPAAGNPPWTAEFCNTASGSRREMHSSCCTNMLPGQETSLMPAILFLVTCTAACFSAETSSALSQGLRQNGASADVPLRI
ncbi:uncharacterized protein LAESUDRAFT_153436 [Laetiporus sulphureus 93-53]|uniref:Uncharacterized protein n=1 Tax=Laetiporus sulphureus 93-53 TaxID=1314785 RepID=A0A165HJL8_9APHY|nr:uncharacterized protein LAESUDRAFT_153436 [Laetiporus sulphureus 93-53]KZT11811.1 hypothetical protein LAESUDRAFT_153436 [Laetiporus sulphureus 93-53]